MSWKAVAFVRSLTRAPNGEPITRAEKLLLFVLADTHHDKAGAHTYPSVETLAEESLMSKREAQRALASLEAKNLIVRERPEKQFRGVMTFYRFPALDITPKSTKRVTPEPPLTPEKDDTTATLKGDTVTALNIAGRVSEGCRKGDISATVYKEEQKQELKDNNSDDFANDASLCARLLSEATGNFNARFQAERSSQLKSESAKRGITCKAVAELMIAQWERYNLAGPKLDFRFGSAAKFWESGVWADSGSWPWKTEHRTQPVNSRRYGAPNATS